MIYIYSVLDKILYDYPSTEFVKKNIIFKRNIIFTKFEIKQKNKNSKGL